jgi:phosphopantothenoylcysteine decarboxylase
VILSPTAATWVDGDHLTEVSGHPVRVEPRTPDDQDPLPPADAILAAPLTFNSLNKWAAGISDTLALGLLNEAIGLDPQVIAAPCIKEALQRHPTYAASTDVLRTCDVTVLDPTKIVARPREGVVTLDWAAVLPS